MARPIDGPDVVDSLAGDHRSVTGAASLVRALHLASTTLPVGAFSYSQGLEWAVEARLIVDRASAERWIADALRHSVVRFEGPLLVAGIRAWRSCDHAAIAMLDDRMRATRETSELRAETIQMGSSLRRWCNETAAVSRATLDALDLLDAPTYPIVFGAVAAGWAIEERTSLVSYLWGWLENQVNAALKALPLGQSDGQRILLSIGASFEPLAESSIALAATPGDWATQCPGLAIASSRHESQYSRLFRS